MPIPTEEREMSVQPSTTESSTSTADVEEDKPDEQFWLDVKQKVKDFDVSWNRAMDEVRAENLIKKHGDNALLVIIDKWPKMKKYQEKPELIPSLEYLISRLTEIILEKDKEKKYEYFRVKENASRPTLLHLAAVQNFLHVARCLVNRYPGILYLKTREGKKSALPVELALRERQDDTAAYLISQMKYDRVQELFLCDEAMEINGEPLVKFYFGDIISYQNPRTKESGMKKTVLAVLDKLINPHWPYLPDRPDDDESNDDIQRALDNVPDDPMNYDFYYHILEADENGRQPRIKVALESEPTKFIEIANPNFNRKSLSCLRRIADSENKEAIQHPVVRMLVSRKWKKFAHTWFCVKAALFLLFLTMLSFALIYGSTREDPTQYNDSADKLRAFCEICSIVLLMFHLVDEFGEIAREGGLYFKVWHNYLDLFGIIITLLVVPLRLAEVKAQWSLAAIGYIFHFLRLLKFSNVTRITGLYTTTLVKIIQKDITRFVVFFSVIYIGFCGAMYMALKVDNMQDSFSNFGWLMLAGFRALVEQQPVDEDYQKFGWLVILILLGYMGVVIVVLLNVLIAQLSYTYSEAKKIAKLQYAADAMRIVTRFEYSRFANWNMRVRNYADGDWISDEDLAKEILEYTEERHPWETVEQRISDVREIMRRVVRKGHEQDPLENVNEKLTYLTGMMEQLSQSK